MELLSLAHFRNNGYAVGFPSPVSAFMGEPGIVVSSCKIKSKVGQLKLSSCLKALMEIGNETSNESGMFKKD